MILGASAVRGLVLAVSILRGAQASQCRATPDAFYTLIGPPHHDFDQQMSTC